MNKERMKRLVLFCAIVLLFTMCDKKESEYETWAQVLLIDDLKGTLNQKQKALITYLNEKDSAVIQEVDIPVFEPITVPSDCVKIAITNDKVEVIARK